MSYVRGNIQFPSVERHSDSKHSLLGINSSFDLMDNCKEQEAKFSLHFLFCLDIISEMSVSTAKRHYTTIRASR